MRNPFRRRPKARYTSICLLEKESATFMSDTHAWQPISRTQQFALGAHPKLTVHLPDPETADYGATQTINAEGQPLRVSGHMYIGPLTDWRMQA